MDELFAYRRELLSSLEFDVDELFRIELCLAEPDWYLRPAGSTHTHHYVLFHLWVLETREFVVQIRRILEEDMPSLEIFDDESWMATFYSAEEPVHSIIQGVSGLRQAEIGMLRDLSPSGWSRSARHPWWGVHALQWWAERQNEITNEHLEQLNHIPGV